MGKCYAYCSSSGYYTASKLCPYDCCGFKTFKYCCYSFSQSALDWTDNFYDVSKSSCSKYQSSSSTSTTTTINYSWLGHVIGASVLIIIVLLIVIPVVVVSKRNRQRRLVQPNRAVVVSTTARSASTSQYPPPPNYNDITQQGYGLTTYPPQKTMYPPPPSQYPPAFPPPGPTSGFAPQNDPAYPPPAYTYS
ncbi:uncharacterized protein LOC141903057 [Tubulanus polymorphus]|uniref:uncharacterized protein LOC141903057 n=1 Tax=Tubulanus polymorphus TaxID=672921 RepID=UPI003DA36FE5